MSEDATTPFDADAAIAEIEARRAARKDSIEQQRKLQLVKDLEALDRLEVEHGDAAIVRIDIPRWQPGLPTMALYRLPTKAENKRYEDTIARGPDNKRSVRAVKAGHDLATVAQIYPERATYRKMCEALAGLHLNASVAIRQAFEGQAAEEGKD